MLIELINLRTDNEMILAINDEKNPLWTDKRPTENKSLTVYLPIVFTR